jgi:drug/metabolite transporter (DMT)-like permease
VPEPVEAGNLLLAVAANGMVLGEVVDQLLHPRPELVGKVRRSRPDEGVDVVLRRLGHGVEANEPLPAGASLASSRVRRPSAAELGLLVTVLIWSLNFTLTKYVLEEGFKPLAYSGLRFTAAALVFAAITYARERSFRMQRDDFLILVGAAVIGIWLNQIGFVYSLKYTTASTAALVFGTLPIFTMFFARISGIEHLTPRFMLASGLSFVGVALVAVGAEAGVAGDPVGIALALLGAGTWAAYSVAIAPLMQRYSPFRISAVALLAGAVMILPTASPQLATQDFDFPPLIWLIFVVAVFGPLVLTNILWFTAIDRVGPSRASLFANLQPFLGALFALLILSERMTFVQVVGGVAIAGGIALARRPRPAIPAAE